MEAIVGFLYACRRDFVWHAGCATSAITVEFLYACRRDFVWHAAVQRSDLPLVFLYACRRDFVWHGCEVLTLTEHRPAGQLVSIRLSA